MNTRRLVLLAGSTVGAFFLSASGARADAIDGNWCAADGRTFSIEGPKILTPGGTATTGDYTRHSFAYVVPSGEVVPGQKGRAVCGVR